MSLDVRWIADIVIRKWIGQYGLLRSSADRMQFRKLMLPLHKFMNETTDRTPMADLINTDGKTIVGFTGRIPSVGIIPIRLLEKE